MSVAHDALQLAASAKAAAIPARQATIVGAIGDSRLAQSIQVGTAGGGATNRKKPQGIMAWFEALSGGAVVCPSSYNQAVSSSLVSDLSGQLDTLLALSPRPDAVVILSGTNSFAAGTTAAAAWADYSAVVARITGLGIRCLCIADLPRQRSTWTAATSHQSQQFNQYYLPQVKAYGAYYIDPAYLIADPANATGDPRSLYHYDGIHPATLTANVVGQELWAVAQTALPLRSPTVGTRADAYDATSNPYGNILEAVTSGSSLFQGTAGTNTSSGGTASGTVASGWNNRTLTGTGTSAASIVARSDGKPGNWQQLIQTSGTGVSTYRFSFITSPVVGTYYAVGDRVQIEMDIDISSASGLEGFLLTIFDFDGAATRGSSQWGDNALIGATYYPLPNFSGRIITDPLTIIASSASVLIRLDTRINNGAATIKMGAAKLRRL